MPIYVRLAMNAGADGYVRKAADARDVVDALIRIAEGQCYVEPALGATLARWEEPLRRDDVCSSSALTAREREVSELLALGHTNAEVGHTLGIAVRTVEAHRGHLMHKLGLNSRAELVRFVTDQQRCI